jgi:hypothetical protein
MPNPNKWLLAKRDEFVTDIVRNFCIVHQQLCREFEKYDQTESVDFEFMSELLGNEMNQGRLWRLKDTAHLLFRFFPDPPLSGQFLDWSIGYIFHESMKLKEDAYQLQNYVPWFQSVQEDGSYRPTERHTGHRLFQLVSQTQESIRREVRRIRFILSECLGIFTRYLSLHSENALLARFIYDSNQLVREVFGRQYEELLRSMFGQEQERLYLLAAQSLRQGGWAGKASQAVEEAYGMNPDNARVASEKKAIDNLLKNA